MTRAIRRYIAATILGLMLLPYLLYSVLALVADWVYPDTEDLWWDYHDSNDYR